MQLICNNILETMVTISSELKQKGYRFTKQRQEIFDALSNFPQSVEEIICSLKKRGVGIDKATIYRTLDCFVDLGLVGKTQFKDTTSKYELVSESSHHHHLICDVCGSVEDIPLNDSVLLKKIANKTKFLVKSHSLEFFGICVHCQ